MKYKADSVIRIPTTIGTEFFMYWLAFLKPFHNLTERESQVLACFLKERYNLSKVVSDTALLDKMTLDSERKKIVKEECKMSDSYYQVVIGNLKKEGIIKDGVLNPKFIPAIKEEKGNFQLLLLFDFQ